MAVCAILLTIMLILGFFGRKHEKDWVKAHQKKLRIPAFSASTGLWLHEKILKRLPARAEKERETASRLLRDAESEKVRIAKSCGAAWLFGLSGAFIGCVLSAIVAFSKPLYEVARPAFGESISLNVQVEGLSDTENLTFSVSGQDPNEETAEGLFDAAFQAMQAVILKDNADFLHVTGNLSFLRENDAGIRFSYESSDPEILSNYGTLFPSEIGAEGRDLWLTVTLSYKTFSKTYTQKIHVETEDGVKTGRERLSEALSDADEKTLSEATVTLPSEVDGQAVRFKKAGVSPLIVTALFLILSVGTVLLYGERDKKEMKNREEELALSYVKLLSKMSAYLQAGMSIRSAWFKLTEDYRIKKNKVPGYREYVYEEMMISANELASGVSEKQAYADFGKRCGQHRYIKFGNLLSQNLRQGISGLQEKLADEMRLALEERKNRALRKGEEAATKLLMPMMIMLGIVIVTIVVPTFMTF